MATWSAPQRVQSGVLQAGSRTFGPFTPPIGATGVRYLLNRARLGNGTTGALSWALELSTNGGATWSSLGGAQIRFTADSPRDVIESTTGQPISGSERGLLVVRNIANGTLRYWVDTLLPGEQYEPGFDPASPTRRLRVSLSNDLAFDLDGDIQWAS